MSNKDPLEDELGKYENKWVAIDEPNRKIVGSGEKAIDALSQAKANGCRDATLFYVRPSGKFYC